MVLRELATRVKSDVQSGPASRGGAAASWKWIGQTFYYRKSENELDSLLMNNPSSAFPRPRATFQALVTPRKGLEKHFVIYSV
jgi:hypothetical protein